MNSSVTLQVSDVVIRVDAYWMRHYAADFLTAAKHFVPPTTRFSPVPHYLICHSIELSLKSFLFTVGFKRADRKRLNHNLEEALKAAELHGLCEYVDVTAHDRDQLRKANKLYSKKEFEYFESLETIYDPLDFDLNTLLSFANKVYEGIEDPVRASVHN